MLKYIFLIIAISFQAPGYGQESNTRDSIKKVIEQLYIAMKTADSTLARNCFAENAVLQTIRTDSLGHHVNSNDLNGFLGFLATSKSGDAEEKISFTKEILIDGPLASAWTPYEFYYKGTYSHCGVNSWQFLRTNAGWKIVYLIDTRRKVCTGK